MNANLKRELQKVLDVLDVASQHFEHEAKMNAALHMAPAVRPAPLAVAITGARDTLRQVIEDDENALLM
jgi:hypothetical protein